MNTEPIGFLGTTGEFIYTKSPGSFVIHLPDNTAIGDIWKDVESCQTKEADTKLLAASKKMAVALQAWIEIAEKNASSIAKNGSGDFFFALLNLYEDSRHVLKEAGL